MRGNRVEAARQISTHDFRIGGRTIHRMHFRRAVAADSRILPTTLLIQEDSL